MIENFHMRQILPGLMAALILLAGPSGVAGAAEARKMENKSDNPLEQPMVFSIVRSAAGYCEPNCPEWIYGEGQIVSATPAAFRKVLKQSGRRKLPLLIVSPGGNVMAALEMGRTVRKFGIDVEVSATRFMTCAPRDRDCTPDGPQKGEYRGIAFSAGAFCWSACPLVLAAGRHRYSSQWAHTGVHQITTVYAKERVYFKERYRMVGGKKKVVSREVVERKRSGTQSTTRLPKATRNALLGYFAEMGVGRKLLDAMLSTPPDRIRRLEPEEMLALGLITELTDTDTLADPERCAEATAPGHCVMRNPAPRTAILPQGKPGNPT
ncbi:MAG: hypothetical protein KDJ87_18860 [Rhizobiaceae bacterium]|nr:hypothetical protein [Rhizobiaceae bacterium]